MGEHKNGKWGRPVGQHNWNPGGNAKAYCYLCQAPHSWKECPLTPAQQAAAGLQRQTYQPEHKRMLWIPSQRSNRRVP